MQVIRYIFRILTIAFFMLGVACENETDTTLTSQQDSISKYLKSSHQPRLIPEAEIGSSLDDQPQYYSQWGLDIYRYIATMYAEGRDQTKVIESGNRVKITYTAYLFKGSSPSIDNMYATNDPNSITKLQESGLNTEYEWSTEPFEFTLGTGEILESLETALEGCREGDSVEIYLTFEAAYGKSYIGKIPSDTSVVWFIDIVSVEK
jgi:hypothetical protein